MSHNSGDTLTPLHIQSVTRDSMRAWAVFLHDPNPIHLDAEVVKAKGLGDREINQGPTNVAYIITMLQKNFPNGTIEELDSRFLDNVYADDEVEAFGTITDITGAAGGNRVACEIGLQVQGRGVVIGGTATVFDPTA